MPDEKERRQAELAACWAGTLPPWLDDQALAEAQRLDRWSSRGINPNDSFRDSTVSAVPAPPLPDPASGSGASRYAAIMDERRAFQERCQVVRSSGKGTALAPAP